MSDGPQKPGSATSAPANGTPIYLRKWFLVMAGLIVVLVVAGISRGQPKSASGAQSAASRTIAPTHAPTPTTPPATAPATTNPPATAPSTTLACPTGSPQANINLSASPAPTIPGTPSLSGFWQVSVSGTVTNASSAPVEFVTASVNILAGSSPQLPELVYPAGGSPFALLNPGQSVPVSGYQVQTVSHVQPTIGPVTISWNWPLGSPFSACPDGDS